MICPTCGVDNEAGSKFCMGCGTPLPVSYTHLTLPTSDLV